MYAKSFWLIYNNYTNEVKCRFFYYDIYTDEIVKRKRFTLTPARQRALEAIYLAVPGRNKRIVFDDKAGRLLYCKFYEQSSTPYAKDNK